MESNKRRGVFRRGWFRVQATAAGLWLTAGRAMASSSGGGMPWDTPLENLRNDLTGPVATGIGVIAFFAAGAMLVLGHEEMNSIVKRVLYIVLGVALVVMGNNALTYLGLTGATVF